MDNKTQQTDPNNPMALTGLSNQPMAPADFASSVRNQYPYFSGWSDSDVNQGIINKFPAYRRNIDDPTIAPQAQGSKWGSLGDDLGGIVNYLFGGVERAGATGTEGLLEAGGAGFGAAGGLLNAVGLKNQGKTLTDWGNTWNQKASQAMQSGVPLATGGTALPIGAEQSSEEAKGASEGNAPSIAGEMGKAGLDAAGTALQQASMLGTPELKTAAFMYGGGAALQDLANGDMTQAGTYGNALVNGVVQGTLFAAVGRAAGFVLGKTAVPLLNWLGGKVAAPLSAAASGVADTLGKMGGNEADTTFTKGVSFVQNQLLKIPELFSANSSGNVEELLGGTSNAANTLKEQYTKSMVSSFSDASKVAADDVEESPLALKRAQDIMKSNIGKQFAQNSIDYGSIKPTALDGESILSSSEVSDTLDKAGETARTKLMSSLRSQGGGGTSARAPGAVLTNFLSHVQSTLENPDLKLGDVMQIMDEAGNLTTSSGEENSMIRDVAGTVFRGVRSELSDADPEVLANWDKYYKTWQTNADNIGKGSFANAYINTSTLNNFVDTIAKGGDVPREQLGAFVKSTGGDEGTAQSLLFNAFLRKASSISNTAGSTAEDGAAYLDKTLASYGDILSADQRTTMERLSQFGKQTLQDQVNWIRTLKGLQNGAETPASLTGENLGQLSQQQSQIQDIDSTGVLKQIQDRNFNGALKGILRSTEESGQFQSISNLLTPEQRGQLLSAFKELPTSGRIKSVFQLVKAGIGVAAGSPGAAILHGAYAAVDQFAESATKAQMAKASEYLLQGATSAQFLTADWLKTLGSRFAAYAASNSLSGYMKTASSILGRELTSLEQQKLTDQYNANQ